MIFLVFSLITFFPATFGVDSDDFYDVVFAVDRYPQSSYCAWKDDIRDVGNLMPHKVSSLEYCLYSYLADNQYADHFDEALEPISELPPISDQCMDVSVLDTEINILWMDEVWREVHMEGHFKLSWYDRRLSWDTSVWKLNEMNLDRKYIWVPDMMRKQRLETEEALWYEQKKVAYTGEVQAELGFVVGTKCMVDYYNFPSDTTQCCFQLRSDKFSNYLNFEVKNPEGRLNSETFPQIWNVSEINVSKIFKGGEGESLMMCAKIRRPSVTLNTEITLPATLSALLFLISPFVGKFKYQHMMKVAAIFIQLFCFQNLARNTEQLGYGGKVPKIYNFYEFTVTMTVLSLVISLLLDLLSKIRWSQPPPSKMFFFSQAIAGGEYKRKVPLFTVQNSEKLELCDTGRSIQWSVVFAGINNVVSCVFVTLYLLGIVSCFL